MNHELENFTLIDQFNFSFTTILLTYRFIKNEGHVLAGGPGQAQTGWACSVHSQSHFGWALRPLSKPTLLGSNFFFLKSTVFLGGDGPSWVPILTGSIDRPNPRVAKPSSLKSDSLLLVKFSWSFYQLNVKKELFYMVILIKKYLWMPFHGPIQKINQEKHVG